MLLDGVHILLVGVAQVVDEDGQRGLARGQVYLVEVLVDDDLVELTERLGDVGALVNHEDDSLRAVVVLAPENALAVAASHVLR